MDLCNLSVIRSLMAEAGINFRKEYGQNFLTNRIIPEDIAESCTDNPESLIIEIGPGIGCLTAELASRYRRVVAVEIDRGLIPVLEKTLAEFDNVTVINEDIMKIDLAALVNEYSEGMPVSVCANLPYYITTPILMLLLESELEIKSITVMVQKEVAQRIASPPGSREYGALSVAAQLYAQADIPMEVPASAFDPQPDVDSALIRLTMLEQRIVADEELPAFRKVVKAAFSQRRKQLKNTLSPLLGGAQQAAEALISAGIDPSRRAETLSVEEFLALTRAAGKK